MHTRACTDTHAYIHAYMHMHMYTHTYHNTLILLLSENDCRNFILSKQKITPPRNVGVHFGLLVKANKNLFTVSQLEKNHSEGCYTLCGLNVISD